MNVIDTDECHVTTIICPISMQYNVDQDFYTLDVGTADIIRQSVAGEVNWEID